MYLRCLAVPVSHVVFAYRNPRACHLHQRVVEAHDETVGQKERAGEACNWRHPWTQCKGTSWAAVRERLAQEECKESIARNARGLHAAALSSAVQEARVPQTG